MPDPRAELLQLIVAHNLNGSQTKAWLYLSVHGFSGLETLAKEIGGSVDTARRAVAKLQKAGLLSLAETRSKSGVEPKKTKSLSFNLTLTSESLLQELTAQPFGIYAGQAAKLLGTYGEKRVSEVLAWAKWLGSKLRNAGGWLQKVLSQGWGKPAGYGEAPAPKPVSTPAPRPVARPAEPRPVVAHVAADKPVAVGTRSVGRVLPTEPKELPLLEAVLENPASYCKEVKEKLHDWLYSTGQLLLAKTVYATFFPDQSEVSPAERLKAIRQATAC